MCCGLMNEAAWKTEREQDLFLVASQSGSRCWKSGRPRPLHVSIDAWGSREPSQ